MIKYKKYIQCLKEEAIDIMLDLFEKEKGYIPDDAIYARPTEARLDTPYKWFKYQIEDVENKLKNNGDPNFFVFLWFLSTGTTFDGAKHMRVFHIVKKESYQGSKEMKNDEISYEEYMQNLEVNE